VFYKPKESHLRNKPISPVTPMGLKPHIKRVVTGKSKQQEQVPRACRTRRPLPLFLTNNHTQKAGLPKRERKRRRERGCVFYEPKETLLRLYLTYHTQGDKPAIYEKGDRQEVSSRASPSGL